MINFELTTGNYVLQTQITAEKDGVIIIDITPGFTLPNNETFIRLQVPVIMDVMDFEFDGSAMKLINASGTTLTPTVETAVSGFAFNASSKVVTVTDSQTNTTVHTASSATSKVQVRVNFSTATITVFE